MILTHTTRDFYLKSQERETSVPFFLRRPSERDIIMGSEPETVTIITREERDQEEQREEDRGEEETWYGWLVVGASFLCNMVIDGMGYSFGVMLQPLMYEFHVGAGEISFVGSILNGVYLLSAPLAAACINR